MPLISGGVEEVGPYGMESTEKVTDAVEKRIDGSDWLPAQESFEKANSIGLERFPFIPVHSRMI